MERRKKIAREKVLEAAAEQDLEVDINDIYPEDKGWKSNVLGSSVYIISGFFASVSSSVDTLSFLA